jgi:RNA polymerase sigma-70 factor, ECF subfamily
LDGIDGATINPVDTVTEPRQDRDAEFDRIFRNTYDRLLRIALRHVGDPEAVADIVQTAAYKSFVRWRRRGKPIENLEAYLTSCVVSACMDLHRGAKRQRRALERIAVEQEPFAESAHGPALRLAEQGAVAQAFGELSVECQEILDLRVLQSISVKDVADRLVIAEGTVKSRCSRCLDQLSRLLSD